MRREFLVQILRSCFHVIHVRYYRRTCDAACLKARSAHLARRTDIVDQIADLA